MNLKSYSQFGEDLLLWQYFRGKNNGFFVEVGANHPTKLSQTWLLEQQGWQGILIEPLSSKCDLLRAERPRSVVIQAAMGAPDQRGRAKFSIASEDDMLSGLELESDISVGGFEDVDVRTLDDVLAETGAKNIDLLSIDVEGLELNVLRGFSIEKYRPAVLLLEDHLQRLSVHRHVVSRGYRLVKRTGCNSWYIPNEADFFLTTKLEKMQLWKQIHLDTPIRCVRFYFKKRRWRNHFE